MSKPLRILSLQVSNIKKIKAVSVAPDGNIVVVTGKNEQGKSSLLDSIFVGLCGGAATKNIEDLISSGKKEGEIKIDVGEYVVIRKARRLSDGKLDVTLKLTTKEGAKVTAPQRILDDLIQTIAFDPGEFSRMKPEDQREELIGLIGKKPEMDRLEGLSAAAYDERTEVNRKLRDIDGEIRAAADHSADLGTEPVEEETIAETLAQIDNAEAHNRALEALLTDLGDSEVSLKETLEKIALLQGRVNEIKADIERCKAEVEKHGAYITVEPLKHKAATLEATNKRIREHNRRVALLGQREAIAAKAESIAVSMADIEEKKKQLFDGADLPIEGLSLTPSGLLYNGIPFSDCATSVKLKVSVAMIMARQPRLRVMVIKEGAFFDSEAMKTIEDLANEYDFQVWIERVEDKSRGAIIIEDGSVVHGD